MFVSWCAYQAGILNTTVPRYSYTPTGAAWYRNRGKYHKRSSGYTPKVGDTVFFFDPSKGRIAHTGIVTNITSTVVYTIEGNASDGVIERCLLYTSLDTERYFIPPQVGLPAKKKYEKDPSWYVCRLCDFEETNEPAEIALTPEVLVENFLRRKNRWVTTD